MLAGFAASALLRENLRLVRSERSSSGTLALHRQGGVLELGVGEFGQKIVGGLDDGRGDPAPDATPERPRLRCDLACGAAGPCGRALALLAP